MADSVDDHIRNREYTRALSSLQKKLGDNPNDKEALSKRLVANYLSGDLIAGYGDCNTLYRHGYRSALFAGDCSSICVRLGKYAEVSKYSAGFEDTPRVATAIKDARTGLETSEKLNRAGSADRLELFQTLISISPSDVALNKNAASEFISGKKYKQALKALNNLSTAAPGDFNDWLTFAHCSLAIGSLENAKRILVSALESDPDNGAYHKLRRTVLKISEAMSDLSKVPSSSELKACLARLGALGSYVSLDSRFPNPASGASAHIRSQLCLRLAKEKQHEQAVNVCRESLGEDPAQEEQTFVLVEALIELGNYEEAKATLERSPETAKSTRLKEKLAELKRREKSKPKESPYDVLGVKRTATSGELAKAMRSLTSKWHPDRFETESEKKKAHEETVRINHAYSILSDPEKRQMVDMGMDPENPQRAQQQTFRRGGRTIFMGGNRGFGHNMEDFVRMMHF